MSAATFGRSPVEGYQPAAIGRRFLARLIDFALPVLAWLPTLGAAGSLRFALAAYLVSLVLLLVIGIVQLLLVLTKGGTIGYRVCGLTHVRVTTGAVSGGRAFGKYILESLLSSCTLGIGLIVMVILIRQPLNQTFLDRALGLLVIDERLGRRGGQPLSEAAPVRTAAHIQPVSAAGLVAETTTTPVSPAPTRRDAKPQTFVPPVVSANPVIQAAPWSTGSDDVDEPAPRAQPAALERPVVMDRPVSGVAMEQAEATSTAISPPVAGPRIELDDGSLVALYKPVVLGREPAAPGGVGDVMTHALPNAGHAVSKTHLAIGMADRAAWVRDLRSTNGVFIRGADGDVRKIEPGKATTLAPHETVLFGDRSLRVVLS
ncbi:RDD family protein [Flexivirga caeni]|uniref:FHA domain-containing protein n=1 Tax=Flexivirga caeni TaxID=2294115 RepID=A0A3M9M9Q2_9MICO|nr:RDD family protein [Flexivirga caeni]RNI22282.1 FHA domain-containing protein [Flexivirga caeni]